MTITIGQTSEKEMNLRLRIPGWASQATVKINGQTAGVETRPGAYCDLRRRWASGDRVELALPMPVVLLESHPLVEENRNQVAVMRGPLVYCLEAADLPAGTVIENVRLPREAKWKVRHEPALLHGITVLRAPRQRSGNPARPLGDAGFQTLFRVKD